MADKQYDVAALLRMGLNLPKEVYALQAIGANPFSGLGMMGFGGEGFSEGGNQNIYGQTLNEDFYRNLLPEQVRNMQVAGKNWGAQNGRPGDVGRLTQEFSTLMNKTKSGSSAELAQRAAADLARYGVNSLSEIKSIRVPVDTHGYKGAKPVWTDVFYNTATGMLIPKDFGSSMKGEGGSYFSLSATDNGMAVPTAAWTDTSDKQELGTIAAMFGTVLGGAALGGAFSGGATGLSSLPAAGTWAQTAAPAMGAAAGEWTLPAALQGIAGGTGAAAAGGMSGLQSAWNTISQLPTQALDAVKGLFESGGGTMDNVQKALSAVAGTGNSGAMSALGTLLNAGLGAYAGSQGGSSKAPSYEQMYGQTLDQAKQNAQWINDQNKQNVEWSLNQNRYDMSNPYGTLDWSRTADGGWQQSTTFAPDIQNQINQMREKSSGIIGGMGQGFDVNGDVMSAIRGLQAPGLQQQRDRENARLAAMGVGTGSGMAWSTAQNTLNDAANQADLNAIIQGFQADQTLRNSNRQDLASMQNLESMWRSGLPQQQGSQVSLPGVTLPGMPSGNSMMDWQLQQQQNQQAQDLAKQQGILQAGQGLLSGIGNWTGWW